MRKEDVAAYKKKHGANVFARIAGTPHKRGAVFKDPEIRHKAEETRRRNRLNKLLEQELNHEVQDHHDI